MENGKNKHIHFSLFLQKQDITNIKSLVRDSAITEVNELISWKILTLRLRFFKCKLSTFITLNSSGRTRQFKINVKTKGKIWI